MESLVEGVVAAAMYMEEIGGCILATSRAKSRQYLSHISPSRETVLGSEVEVEESRGLGTCGCRRDPSWSYSRDAWRCRETSKPHAADERNNVQHGRSPIDLPPTLTACKPAPRTDPQNTKKFQDMALGNERNVILSHAA